MKILNYICGRPLRSAGTAPLIYNPIRKWLIILMTLYICLSLLSYGVFLYPKASDLHCSPLIDSLFSFSVSIGASNLMAPYYSVISCREWGTENEWSVVAVVSAVMAIIDLSSSFYGIYVLCTIIDVVFTNITGMPDCTCYKAIVFFFANATLVFIHLVVAIVSIVVYFVLMANIDKQLEDNRNVI